MIRFGHQGKLKADNREHQDKKEMCGKMYHAGM